MARIRTIKPEFFTSEDIVSLTPLARVFYIALWCEADREGRLDWKPGTLKMRYLPGDDCNVKDLAGELISAGLIVLYEVNGKQYAEVPTFKTHQVINNRESESTRPSRNFDASARVKAEGKEGREEEGKGKEGEGNAEANASGADAPQKSIEDLTKDELWSAGKSLLTQAGMPSKQCGSFVGKLVKDYTDAVVIDAVRAAVLARPADPAEYLKAACMRMAGQRPSRPLKPSQMTDAERNSIAAAEAEKAKRLLFGDSEGSDFVDVESIGVGYEAE
jgi:hypothetical protein